MARAPLVCQFSELRMRHFSLQARISRKKTTKNCSKDKDAIQQETKPNKQEAKGGSKAQLRSAGRSKTHHGLWLKANTLDLSRHKGLGRT